MENNNNHELQDNSDLKKLVEISEKVVSSVQHLKELADRVATAPPSGPTLFKREPNPNAIATAKIINELLQNVKETHHNVVDLINQQQSEKRSEVSVGRAFS